MSLPSRFKRLGRRVERARLSRVGDLLDADDDVHGVVVCAPGPTATNRIVRRTRHCRGPLCDCFSSSTRPLRRSPLASRVVIQKALERRPPGVARRDEPPGPCHPSRAGRGGRRRRRRRRARRRRHPERGRQRAGRHRDGAGGAAGRLDERLRPHDRPAERPDRSDRCAARRARRSNRCARSAWAASTTATSCSTPGSASTLPSSVRSSVATRSSAGSAIRSSSTRPSSLGSATTTAVIPTSVCTSTTAVVDDGYFTVVHEHLTRTRFSATARSTSLPEATFDRGLVAVTVRSLGMSMATTLARTAFMNPRDIAQARARSTSAPTSTASRSCGHRPFPYQVDGDYLGEVDRLQFRHEPNALNLVLPDLAASGPAEHG